ncbi:MAG: DUF721 domain-containing protein [Acidobacteria bacterium]|nr:DUF721 domain-containing protein [Acidobacteriota bacterium]
MMKRAAAGLEKIVSDALGRTPATEAPLLAWPLACGTLVAQRTRPLECAQGVLRVEVPNAGWRAELETLAPQYVAIINRYVRETVRRIEFVVGRTKPE